LSGDCSKRLLVPPVIEVCEAPESGLDVVGWLAAVWCEVRTIPARVGAFVVWLGNVMIDLVQPGQRLQALIFGVEASVKSHVPFSWIAALTSRLSEGVSTSETGLPAEIEVMGTTVTVPWALAEAAEPFRGWLVPLVYLEFGLWALAVVQSFIGWHPPGPPPFGTSSGYTTAGASN